MFFVGLMYVAVSTQYLHGAYLLYYYSFLPKQIEYKDVNRKIFTKRNVSTMIDKLKSLLLEFLACFIKPEALQVSSCKKLMSLDIDKNLLSREDIFVGN